ncbi:MAG: hypothetical protein HYT71_02505 [Candidatus Aenigmarchaeota archaeon]|nr:hypothetical protein [Candidatus Aenigmarchaeota archaeon]
MAVGLELLSSPVTGVFVVLALAEYIGIRKMAEKAFNWVAAGGVLLLLSGITAESLGSGTLGMVGLGSLSFGSQLAGLFSVLGGISVLVGSLLAALTLLQEA